MKRPVGLVFVLVLIAGPTGYAGDLRYTFIKHDPNLNWSPGTLDLTGDASGKIEEEIGDPSVNPLHGQCPLLSALYGQLSKPGTPYNEIARRIARIHRSDTFVYFVDDQKGLTVPMQEYAGLCHYVDSNVSANSRYAYLCGHDAGTEGALKLGEHFAASFMNELKTSFAQAGAPGGDTRALLMSVLGEMLGAVLSEQWQPNNLIVKGEKLSQSSYGLGETAKDGSPGPSSTLVLTLMPTEEAAKLRTLQIYLSLYGSMKLRDLYEKFPCDQGYFSVEKMSETHQRLAGGRKDNTPGHAYLQWSKISPENLRKNEVFGALVLYHISFSQPKVMIGATSQPALFQVLEHIDKNRGKLGLVDVIDSLMEYYETAFPNDEAKAVNRWTYIVALVDLASGGQNTKEALASFFAGSSMSRKHPKLLDDYFEFNKDSIRTIKPSCPYDVLGAASLGTLKKQSQVYDETYREYLK